MLGLVMSTYGIAMMLGEFSLSQVSDRLGRKPVIMIGLVFFLAQFIGLAVSRDYILIAATFVIVGLGNALFDPTLSAYILDIIPQNIKGVFWVSRARRDRWEAFSGPPWSFCSLTSFRHRVFSWSQWAQCSLLLWCFGSPRQSRRQPGRSKGG